MALIRYILCTTILLFLLTACAQTGTPRLVEYDNIIPGDHRTEKYMPLIEDKTTGVVANHSSIIGQTHLVDTLLQRNVQVTKVFSPEHGFRGNEDAGALTEGNTDTTTGIQFISLYGKHKKPTKEDMEGVEVMLFDLQDVGVRFYTYISTLTYVMEACAENGIPLIVLDRPNPNGFYVDGPLLEKEFSSFVGMHEVPIVYGMTIGEYALMVNGEGWLDGNQKCNLTVIKMLSYDRDMIVKLPIKPSPNLPNWRSVYLYPSLCLFEGTIVSVGRGTDRPFQMYGHPDFPPGNYTFTPESVAGASKPMYKGVVCYGFDLASYAENYAGNPPLLNITWLQNAYNILGSEHEFFTSYFDKLAGTDKLRKQIEAKVPEKEIRASWKNGLAAFNKIRQQYLIY